MSENQTPVVDVETSAMDFLKAVKAAKKKLTDELVALGFEGAGAAKIVDDLYEIESKSQDLLFNILKALRDSKDAPTQVVLSDGKIRLSEAGRSKHLSHLLKN